MADFPGAALIDEIIHVNPLGWLPSWAKGFPQVSLHNGRDSNKCLDVSGAGTANGTKIQVWQCNQSAAQTWIEEYAGGRIVYHSAVDFDKCLDLEQASTSNGTKIQLYDCNYTPAQMWLKESATSGSAILHSSLDYGKCVDMSYNDLYAPANGAQVQIWDCNGLPQQEWRVESRHGHEKLTFKSGLDGDKCLDVYGGIAAAGDPVVLWDCNGTAAQEWVMDDAGRIHSWIDYNKCLDTRGRLHYNGTDLLVLDCQDPYVPTQRWE